MIKQKEDITISDLAKIESSGSVRHLHLKCKLIPIHLLYNRIEKVTSPLINGINNRSDDLNEALNDSIDQTVIKLKIQLLKINYSGVVSILNIRSKLNSRKKNMSRRMRRKMHSPDTAALLKKYIKKLEQYTDLKITKYDDFNKIKEEIERRVDVFEELFEQSETVSDERITIRLFALRLFLYMEEKIDMEMKVVDFINLKNLAEEKQRLHNAKNDE